ncbi:MAG TPA: hypothetical protein VFJ85_11275 [Acidimicrobiales bacterium]|nr:hypothetical protein [Acidimicrobiales bacterium]
MLLKTAIGAGFAAASLTLAGAAGALPGPAQNVVASTVAAVTPWTFPEKANSHAEHGKTVSTDAHDGGAHGKAVSDAAKHKHDGDSTDTETTTPDDSKATGLDRANETPAAGHVPTSVPGANADGKGGPDATGPDRAAQTPAAGHAPDETATTEPQTTDTTDTTEAPAAETHGGDHGPSEAPTTDGGGHH